MTSGCPMLTGMKAPSNLPSPIRQLGEPGLDLWTSIQSEYFIEDAAGQEVLMAACSALDRAEALAARIAADGPTIPGPSGPRVHPCIAAETAARMLVVRCLTKLGLLHEPIKPMGRPVGSGKRKKLDDHSDYE